MGQRAVNAILLVGLSANLTLLGYLYWRYEGTVSALEAAAAAPFELPGRGLAHYDMSSPEAMLTSARSMILNVDIKAGVEYLKLTMLSESDPFIEYLLADDAQVSVEKTHVVKDSSQEDATGTILAFVRITANGVEHHFVGRYQRKNGILVPASFYLFDFNKDNWTNEDKYLYEAMEAWENTGKLL